MDGSEGGEGAAAGVVVVVAAGSVGVAALVGGDHHAAVLRQPLHTLLHAAVAVGAPVVAPARMQSQQNQACQKISLMVSSIKAQLITLHVSRLIKKEHIAKLLFNLLNRNLSDVLVHRGEYMYLSVCICTVFVKKKKNNNCFMLHAY